METEPQFLIWSQEHGAWWRPGSAGYTRSIFEAGKYTFAAAMAIVSNANQFGETNEVALFAIVLTLPEYGRADGPVSVG